MMRRFAVAALFLTMACAAGAQSNKEGEGRPKSQESQPAEAATPKNGDKLVPAGRLTYKKTEQANLILKGYYPEDLTKGDRRPAIILFHGGGWVCGKPQQFYQQARAFRDQGIVAFSATYPLINKHHTTVYECVKDGKSAVRWLRTHAEQLGIDPDKIIAGGGSAGGHLAACTATIEGFEEEGEGQTVSSKPNTLILFSPVLDTTEKGYGADKMIKGEKTDISPCHHVREGLPPTIIFYGTRDTTVPPENPERFADLMKEAGNHCVLVPFEGRRHGFFNGSGFRRNNTDEDFNTTLEKSIEFLKSIKFLPQDGRGEQQQAQ